MPIELFNNHIVDGHKETYRTKGEKAFFLIKEDVLWGEFPPGQILTERDLVERYKVSRSPIREALVRATSEGLITETPRRGYVVKSIGVSDAQEIFFLRSILEPEAAVLACNYITESEIKVLEKLAEHTYMPGNEDSIKQFLKINKTFHAKIATYSRNRYLTFMISRMLDDLTRIFYEVIIRSTGHEQKEREEHKKIVEALASHDPDKARKAVEFALNNGSRRLSNFQAV